MSSLSPGLTWPLVILGLYLVALVIRACLFRVSRLLFGTTTSGIKIYSFLFLPGVIIHEMAHFLVAILLRVPTGKIEIFPDEIDEGRVKMGSVQIAKTDFVRGSLIGAAPLVLGIVLLIVLAQYESGGGVENQWSTWSRIYLLVTVSNSMFVSREDRRGWFGLGLLIVASLVVAVYFLGSERVWMGLGDYSSDLGERINKGLLTVLKINAVLASGLWLMYKLIFIVKRKI